MNASAQSRAERRWVADVVVAFSVYGVLAIGTPWIAKESWPASARFALALASMVPIAYFAHALLAFYRTRDELQRRQMAEATIAAAAVVGLCTFAWGWLELAGLLPPLHSLWILPALFGVFWAALYFIGRRFR